MITAIFNEKAWYDATDYIIRILNEELLIAILSAIYSKLRCESKFCYIEIGGREKLAYFKFFFMLWKRSWISKIFTLGVFGNAIGASNHYVKHFIFSWGKIENKISISGELKIPIVEVPIN